MERILQQFLVLYNLLAFQNNILQKSAEKWNKKGCFRLSSLLEMSQCRKVASKLIWEGWRRERETEWEGWRGRERMKVRGREREIERGGCSNNAISFANRKDGKKRGGGNFEEDSSSSPSLPSPSCLKYISS